MAIILRLLNISVLTLLISLQAVAQKADEKSSELLKHLLETNGGLVALNQKKDVQYNYIYDNFEKGKDVSLEKYIFSGEQSWGAYETHQIHVLPKKEGKAIQALVNNKPMLTLNEEKIMNPEALGITTFLRKVNFFWFTMMYKLNDSGTIHKYLGTEEVNGVIYDKVSLTYEGEVTKKAKNDEYILYYNPKTHLVDQFYFNIVDKGFDKPIIKMTLEYKKIEGIFIATKRKSYKPNKSGEYELKGEYTSSNIKFNNGFDLEDFKL